MSYYPRTHPARFQPSVHPALKLTDDISDEEKEAKLHQAGKIAAEVRNIIISKVKPGASVLDLCVEADDLIRKNNAFPAFPMNVSRSGATAHYTSPPGDTLIIPDVGVVKVDVGVHIDGFIADTAESVDLDGSYQGLVQATIDATNMGIKLIRPRTLTGDLGGVIEKVIRDAGFEPIRELSGHLIDRYIVHGGKTIPCIGEYKGDQIEVGETYAIETFASDQRGSVHADMNRITIYRAAPIRVKIRSSAAKQVQKAAIHNFGGMPFAERWLIDEGISRSQARVGLKELQRLGGIVEYHVLKAASPDSMTSQYEHTMIIKETGAEVTTI